MHLAFALNYGETYLSVNRLAVPTYPSDVKSFVESHSKYIFGINKNKYRRAVLNVGDIRAIDVKYRGKKMNVDVEVEPRDFHTKSHAGIFTRYQQKNVKSGEKLVVNHDNEIASDVILLKVQFSLLRQALVETCKL